MVEFLGEEDYDDDIRLLLSVQDNIYLDEANIPQNLHEIMPLAEKWGTLSNVLMFMILQKLGRQTLQELIDTVQPYMGKIMDWLSHPPTDVSQMSAEYRAFDNLHRGIDSAKTILNKYHFEQ